MEIKKVVVIGSGTMGSGIAAIYVMLMFQLHY